MDDTTDVRDILDAVVIGGGSAGLAGAVVLARARRSVLVIDAGTPRNAPAEGVHSFLGHEGRAPGDLLASGRAELASYGGSIMSGLAVGAEGDARTGFRVTLSDGRSVAARSLLVTSGLSDDLPDVPGLRERWGHEVVHCPYCHGWEIRDRAIGVLGTGPLAAHQAQLFRQWSDDVILFRHTAPELSDDDERRLAARGIEVVEGRVAGLEITDGALSGVQLADGRVVARGALAVHPRMVARSAVLDSLGLEAQPHPMGAEVGVSYPVGPMGATAVAGVFAAGNVTDLQAGVIQSAGQAVFAAAGINASLIEAEIAAAVDRTPVG